MTRKNIEKKIEIIKFLADKGSRPSDVIKRFGVTKSFYNRLINKIDRIIFLERRPTGRGVIHKIHASGEELKNLMNTITNTTKKVSKSLKMELKNERIQGQTFGKKIKNETQKRGYINNSEYQIKNSKPRPWIIKELTLPSNFHSYLTLPEISMEEVLLTYGKEEGLQNHQLAITTKVDIDLFQFHTVIEKKLDFELKYIKSTPYYGGEFLGYIARIFSNSIIFFGKKGMRQVNPHFVYNLTKQLVLKITRRRVGLKLKITYFEIRIDVDAYDEMDIIALLNDIVEMYCGRIVGPYGSKLETFFYIPFSLGQEIYFKYYQDGEHRTLESVSYAEGNSFPEHAIRAMEFVMQKLETEDIEIPKIMSWKGVKEFLMTSLQLKEIEADVILTMFSLYKERKPTTVTNIINQSLPYLEKDIKSTVDTLVEKKFVDDYQGNLWFTPKIKRMLLSLYYQIRSIE